MKPKNNCKRVNLVPRASFPLTSGRKTRALGATISGMRHRCRCAVSRITRIRLFPLFFHNGCSQSSRFPTAGQGERSSGNEIAREYEGQESSVILSIGLKAIPGSKCILAVVSVRFFLQVILLRGEVLLTDENVCEAAWTLHRRKARALTFCFHHLGLQIFFK